MRNKIYTPFYLPILPVICFGNTTGLSTKLTQNNLQTASRIQFFFNISVTLVMFIIENICKSKVLFSFPRPAFIKTASAIQYKSRYKYRSAVALMKTRTKFSAILFGKMGALFVTRRQYEQAVQFYRGQTPPPIYWVVTILFSWEGKGGKVKLESAYR